eukprot:364615-Chlamydomonas_euryale.AAC.21
MNGLNHVIDWPGAEVYQYLGPSGQAGQPVWSPCRAKYPSPFGRVVTKEACTSTTDGSSTVCLCLPGALVKTQLLRRLCTPRCMALARPTCCEHFRSWACRLLSWSRNRRHQIQRYAHSVRAVHAPAHPCIHHRYPILLPSTLPFEH